MEKRNCVEGREKDLVTSGHDLLRLADTMQLNLQEFERVSEHKRRAFYRGKV